MAAEDSDGPLLVCYDGSEHAKYAIARAASLFGKRSALVLTVWQPLASQFVLAGPIAPVFSAPELDDAGAENAERLAREGAQLASDAGMEAEPLIAEAVDAVWPAIIEVADNHDAAAIVIGSRGHSGVHAALMGSVSNAVVHHAQRPTLVVHTPRPKAS